MGQKKLPIEFPKEHLGNFINKGRPVAEYETWTLSSYAPFEREGESELFRSKWFDYRRMHPMEASCYFLHCYGQNVQYWWKRTKSADEAKNHFGVRVRFWEEKTARFIWHLRRWCDTFGIEYKFFLTQMEMLRREDGTFHDRNKYYPRPHVFLPKDCAEEEKILALWKESPMRYAKDPFFRSENWIGDEDQKDYENFVIERLKIKGASDLLLLSAICDNRAVTVERAVKEFGLERISRLLRMYDR